MRPQYAALVAAFLDSVAAASIPETADSIVVPNRLEKRANTTVIPAPINVEPSQYWEGNDGPWLVKSQEKSKDATRPHAEKMSGPRLRYKSAIQSRMSE